MLTEAHAGADILRIIGEVPAGTRKDKRYWDSEKINVHTQYWATVTPRSKSDHVGVQFAGAVGLVSAQ
jgi:hypothetical protein